MAKRAAAFVVSFLLVSIANLPGATTSSGHASDALVLRDTIQDSLRIVIDENPIAPEESFRRKKLITSILAFPVPFGFVGLHRIYLGTEPWVPIVYLCTAGGGLGLLPLIDFIYLVTANEEEFKKYENNPKVFMFVE
jgi:TM2 domain-containing membrane protein YozV